MNQFENQNKPPAKQWLSSIGQQLLGSVPFAIAIALAGTKLAYNLGLPEAAAASLASQIQALCFGGGFVAAASAAIQLPLRGRDLTQDRLQRAKMAPNMWPANGDTPAPPDAPDDERLVTDIENANTDSADDLQIQAVMEQEAQFANH